MLSRLNIVLDSCVRVTMICSGLHIMDGVRAIAALAVTFTLAAQTHSRIFYAPKPIEPMPYVEPMKPLVRLADLKLKHKGQTNWGELVVYDKNNRAEVIAAA